MGVGDSVAVARQIRTVFEAGAAGTLSDEQLLDRFTSERGSAAEWAFAVLVERHGPMVLRVCRNVLRDPEDAEDAFQATFLVLVRKAGAIRGRASTESWLYGVALRVSSDARKAAARRRAHEREGAAMTTRSVDHSDRRRCWAVAPRAGRQAAGEVSSPDRALLFRGPHARRRPRASLGGRSAPSRGDWRGRGSAAVAADSPRPGTSDRGLGDGSRAAAGFSDRRAAGPGPSDGPGRDRVCGHEGDRGRDGLGRSEYIGERSAGRDALE